MIISFGEALIDFLPCTAAGKTEASSAYLPAVGGSPANVAVGVGRLEVPVGFAGGLSHDFFGDLITAHLRDSNVLLNFSKQLQANTTLAFVSLDRDTPRYAFFDEASANRLYQPPDVQALGANTKIVHFGSFSLGVEPIGSRLEKLMQSCRHNRLISLDPNIRPSLVPDEQAYRRRLESCLDIAHIIKISDEDLGWLYPQKKQEDIAHSWLAKSAKLVVITRGHEGASAFTSQHHVHVAAQKAKFVDAIGAGDSFMAGLLAHVAQKIEADQASLKALTIAQLQEMLGFAAKCAAITVSRAGANPPYLKEVL